ncbi:MAG: DUF917 domain-containing protein [Holophagales bacterium]|nr:DUF917 domain-containing protein [Holophagales bacterium]
METFGRDDLLYLAHGATLLGSGGGGTLSSTLEMIGQWFPEGRRVDLASVEEAEEDDSSFTGVVSFLGSPAENERLSDLTAAIRAAEAMDRWLARWRGKPLGRTLALEMGVQSSAVVHLLVASALGLHGVDADGVGRAVPWLEATLFAGADLPTGPAFLTDAESCELMVEAKSPQSLQEIATRLVAGPPFDRVAGLALWPLDGPSLRCTIPAGRGTRGSIRLARDLGEILCQGERETEAHLLRRLEREDLEATVVFRGELVAAEAILSDDHQIVRLENGSRAEAVCYSASENLVLWGDAEGRSAPLVTAPDSICFLAPDGTPYSNTSLPQPGSEIRILAIAARRAVAENPRLAAAFRQLTRGVGYPGRPVPLPDAGSAGAEISRARGPEPTPAAAAAPGSYRETPP